MFQRRHLLGWSACAALAAALPRGAYASDTIVQASSKDGTHTLALGEQPALVYVTADKKISRPFFHSLKAADGTPLSRPHPPQAGDPSDHDLFHPGLWLAFGDLSGHDGWRLNAPVKQQGFTEKGTITTGDKTPMFTCAVDNRYLTKKGDEICREACRYLFRPRHGGWLLTIDSTFTADKEFYFGDQEEMGLGVRLATPLLVKNGGAIRNSHGDQNEKGCWGKRAAWCDYSGLIDKKRAGILLLPHPDNFKPSSFHARDYGALVANPFAEQAFGRAKAPAKTIVKPGASLRLRYGVLAYRLADEKPLDGDKELAYYAALR
jgi:hypothetical protein